MGKADRIFHLIQAGINTVEVAQHSVAEPALLHYCPTAVLAQRLPFTFPFMCVIYTPSDHGASRPIIHIHKIQNEQKLEGHRL